MTRRRRPAGRLVRVALRVEAGSVPRLRRPPWRQDDREIHACTYKASSVVRPRWIRDIRWWIATRPVVLLAREVGPRMCVDIRGDIERLAIGQRAWRIERHIAADEFGGGADARHARADVVRLGTPHRRRSRRS